MNRIACFLTALLAAVSLPVSADETAARPWRVEDLFLSDGFGSTVATGKGQGALSVRSWIDADTKRQRQSLWIVEGDRDNAQPLETGEPNGWGPVLSPDGRWGAFLSTREKPADWPGIPQTPPESDPPADVWLVNLVSRKVIPLAGPAKPFGRVFTDRFYAGLRFSPDGTRLVFIADDGTDPRTPEEIEADVFLVREDQGEGYTGFGPAQVWIAHLDAEPDQWAAARIERLTEDDVWYGDPQWSPDGKRIVVHANRTDDRESVRYSINKNFDLWELDVATRDIRQLTFGPGPEVSPRFSPDGRLLACLSVPRRGPHSDVYNLAVVDLANDPPSMRIVYDHHNEPEFDPERPSPAFPLPEDCWEDGRRIVYQGFSGTETKTVRIDVETAEFDDPDADESSHRLALQQQRRDLTPRSSRTLPARLNATSRVVRWDNGEGWEIEGVLTVPHPDIAQPPYRMILFPHGGPHHRATRGVGFTQQIFASEGYLVFEPNFRGSTGYGRTFLDADRGDFGGGDMRDILTGIDKLIADGVVDAGQQYVYGVSYGGYMTCWLVGQTNRFRAAVAQNAVTDLTMMWSLSDLQSWTEWEFGGRPWEVPDKMRKHSPLTYVGNVETPTLILHSERDRRCPVAMGYAFHQSLRARDVPTEMVVYPDEGHGIRDPRRRADVLHRTLEWFRKHRE
jgi:dipeptidyl aminopeptidase/acylaminoacyl peptidase